MKKCESDINDINANKVKRFISNINDSSTANKCVEVVGVIDLCERTQKLDDVHVFDSTELLLLDNSTQIYNNSVIQSKGNDINKLLHYRGEGGDGERGGGGGDGLQQRELGIELPDEPHIQTQLHEDTTIRQTSSFNCDYQKRVDKELCLKSAVGVSLVGNMNGGVELKPECDHAKVNEVTKIDEMQISPSLDVV